MKSWTKPTNERLEQAIALMTQPEHRRRFFERLENPEWLAPLRERGFFRNPPGPESHEDEGQTLVWFPAWAESRYLARMARWVPKQVAEIVREMQETENSWVHGDLIDAGLGMPASVAIGIVRHAKRWLGKSHAQHWLLTEKVGRLAAKLATEGQVDAGFELADALLSLGRKKVEPLILPDGTRVGGSEAYARLGDGEYKRAIEEVCPTLAEADARRVVSLLCDKLEKALRIEGRVRGAGRGTEDDSSSWRRAIEDRVRNLGRDVKDCLVAGIRDVSLNVAKEKPERARKILDDLEGRGLRIFKRIALHILCEVPDADPERLEQALLDRALFDDWEFHHEYYRLLERHFGVLDAEGQSEIYQWIEAGLSLEGSDEDAEEVERARREWQLGWLFPIRGCLPECWREKYARLEEEFGQPEQPGFLTTVSSWVGPTSPATAQDLAAMADAELLEFLRSWRPSGEREKPTPRGLAEALKEAAAKEPARFAALAPATKRDVDPTYVAGLLSGLWRASQDGKPFEWKRVVELCEDVARRPGEHTPLVRDDWDADQDWGAARRGAAHLLSYGLQPGATEIPFDLRGQVWDALRALAEDPDPRPEREKEDREGALHPYELAINTVRGEAMEGVVLYGLWCLRHLRPEGGAQDDQPVVDEVAEVTQVLERHLDPGVDPSPAVRSVYGRFLPWLVQLDESWAELQLARIFPEEPGLERLRDAAWETYITLCAPYNRVWEMAEPVYRRAVQRLRPKRTGRRFTDDAETRLGEHLVVFYMRGRISLEAEGSLLREFFDRACVETRADVVGRAGWELHRLEKPLSEAQVERLRRLWEFRLEAARESEEDETRRKELPEFGSWFATEVFGSEWALKTLEGTLELSGGCLPHGKEVCERLASLAAAYPAEVLRCLQMMVKGDTQGHGIVWWSPEIRGALEGALSSGDEQARKQANDLINELGARGFHQFQDLLESVTPEE